MVIHDVLSLTGSPLCLTSTLQNQFAALNVPKKDDSQIEGPSIANSYGFKVSMQNLQEAKALHEVRCAEETYENLELMVVELFLSFFVLFCSHKSRSVELRANGFVI